MEICIADLHTYRGPNLHRFEIQIWDFKILRLYNAIYIQHWMNINCPWAPPGHWPLFFPHWVFGGFFLREGGSKHSIPGQVISIHILDNQIIILDCTKINWTE